MFTCLLLAKIGSINTIWPFWVLDVTIEIAFTVGNGKYTHDQGSKKGVEYP
jgi:hypothetical protein